MANRYISISDVLNEKLKHEENASALISQLLNHYYMTNEINHENKNKYIQEINNKKEEIELIEKKIVEEEKKVNTYEEEQKEYEERKRGKDENFKTSFYSNFKEEVGREPTEKEYTIYKELWDNDLINNLFEYTDKIKELEKNNQSI